MVVSIQFGSTLVPIACACCGPDKVVSVQLPHCCHSLIGFNSRVCDHPFVLWLQAGYLRSAGSWFAAFWRRFLFLSLLSLKALKLVHGGCIHQLQPPPAPPPYLLKLEKRQDWGHERIPTRRFWSYGHDCNVPWHGWHGWHWIEDVEGELSSRFGWSSEGLMARERAHGSATCDLWCTQSHQRRKKFRSFWRVFWMRTSQLSCVCKLETGLVREVAAANLNCKFWDWTRLQKTQDSYLTDGN